MSYTSHRALFTRPTSTKGNTANAHFELPEYRNAGIGSRLLGGLLDEAAQSGKPIRIHVEKFNPALRFYQRLGFAIVEDRGVYWFMEWTQSAAPPLSRLEVSGRGDQVSRSFSDRMMKGVYDV